MYPDAYVFTPEQFGAVGDGTADDTTAFQQMAAAVNSAGGGAVVMRAKATYLVGGQTPGGGGYAFQGKPVFTVSGLSALQVVGNGARLQMKSGLRYGSFNADGTPAPSSSSQSKAATIGSIVNVSSSKNIQIDDLVVDGALPTLLIGGDWDPPEIQLDAVGIRLTDVENVHLNNVVCSSNGLDGIYIRGNRRTKYPVGSDNILLTNVDCNYNGRQGMSWIGGHGLTVLNSRFRNTSQGSSYTGNPGAGVDIEPNGSDWASQALFMNCSFENNIGVGLLADTGNSRGLAVRDCEFWQGFQANGTTVLNGGGDAIWTSRANVVVDNCRVHGTMTHSPADGSAMFSRCDFDNAVHPIFGQAGVNRRSSLVQQCPGTYEDCTFAASVGGDYRTVYQNGATYRRCTFSVSGAAPGANYGLAYFGNDTLEDCTISDNLTNPASGGHLYVVTNVTIRGRVINAGPNVGWGARIVADGFVGELTGRADLTNSLRFGTQTNPGQYYRAVSVPTSGTYNRGDIVFNRTPSAGGTVGWVCVASYVPASGTNPAIPASWKAFGAIDV